MRPAGLGGSVEVPVGGLKQCGVGVGPIGNVEAVQRGQRPQPGDFEDGTLSVRAASFRGPVKVPVLTQHQSGIGGGAVRAISKSTKTVKRGQRSARIDLEHRSLTVRSTRRCSSIEIAVRALNQRRKKGIGAVAAGEIRQRGKSLRLSQAWERETKQQANAASEPNLNLHCSSPG